MSLVVKIQRALTNPSYPALVYNEARDVLLMVPMTDEIRGLMGDAVRIFAEVMILRGDIVVVGVLDDQPW